MKSNGKRAGFIPGGETARYIIVGIINTAFSYAAYAFFIFLGLHYAVATLFQMISCIIFNFFTFGKYVFNDTGKRHIVKFTAVYLAMYVMFVLGVKFLRQAGADNYLAGAVMMPPVALLSYVLNKYVVFTKTGHGK